jgi:hypothetical protein
MEKSVIFKFLLYKGSSNEHMQFMNSLSSSMLVVFKKKRVNLFSYSIVFNTFYKTKKVLCFMAYHRDKSNTTGAAYPSGTLPVRVHPVLVGFVLLDLLFSV